MGAAVVGASPTAPLPRAAPRPHNSRLLLQVVLPPASQPSPTLPQPQVREHLLLQALRQEVEALLKTPALHHHPLAILLPQQQLTSNNLRFDDD